MSFRKERHILRDRRFLLAYLKYNGLYSNFLHDKFHRETVLKYTKDHPCNHFPYRVKYCSRIEQSHSIIKYSIQYKKFIKYYREKYRKIC